MKGMHITPEQIRRFAERSAAASMALTKAFDAMKEAGQVVYRFVETTNANHPDDNPAYDIYPDQCPMCVQPTLYRFKGGFADEPPGLPHANCTQCGYTE